LVEEIGEIKEIEDPAKGLFGRAAPLAMKVRRPACRLRQRTMRLVFAEGASVR